MGSISFVKLIKDLMALTLDGRLWSLVAGRRSPVTGYWLLVSDHCLVVTGHFFLRIIKQIICARTRFILSIPIYFFTVNFATFNRK